MLVLTMLDSDYKHIEKIRNALNKEYTDLEIYAFGDKQSFLNKINDGSKIDVILMDYDLCKFDEIEINCAKAYLTRTREAESIDDIPVVCKFIKLQTFNEQIRDLHDEHLKRNNIKKKVIVNENVTTKIVQYLSYAGGTGTTTLAVADAIKKASMGFKTLYLNLELFDTTSNYFKSDELKTFSDLILSILDGGNSDDVLSMLIKDEQTSVYFVNPSKVVLDKKDLFNVNDINVLMNVLTDLDFDYIVVDKGMNFDEYELNLLYISDENITVLDGTLTSIEKFLRMKQALMLLDEDNETDYASTIKIIYNKLSSTNCHILDDSSIRVLCKVNKYASKNEMDIVNEIIKIQNFGSKEYE